MGSTKIMLIRHAEKPGTYNGRMHYGVDSTGAQAGSDGARHLTTLGWQRAGGLVTLFVPPWGPKDPALARPQHLYASDPAAPAGGDADPDDAGSSERPYETLIPVAAALGSPDGPVQITTQYGATDYDKMVADALACQGAVLIAWQHEDISLLNKKGGPGISQYILSLTETPDGTLAVPSQWPAGPQGARYDLIWVFDRPSGSGPMTGFTLVAQMLLAGDAAAPSTA